MAATIYDVARAAGVSPATVSRVVNRPELVSAQARQRVLAAIDELDFRPRAEAVARARLGIRSIGVVAPFAAHQAAARRLAGIVKSAPDQVEIVLYNHPSATETYSPTLAALPVRGRLDGLIVMSLPIDDDTAARLLNRRVPTVLLDTHHTLFPSIATDDEAGGRLVAEYMLSRGRRRFGFIGENPRRQDSPSAQRWRGFSHALREAGTEWSAIKTGWTGDDFRETARVALRILGSTDGPIAVFASDDGRGAGVLQAAAALGKSVPDDALVFGFDESQLAQVLGLATVRQPLEESGALAVSMILAIIEGDDVPPQSVLRVQLVPRRSAGV